MSTATFQTIDRNQLKSKLGTNAGRFYLWDTRSAEYFNNEVLPGAKWVPLTNLEKTLKDLGVKKEADIVVYCASFTCPASKSTAEQLTALGYKNVAAFEGGLADWKEAGFPTETVQN